MAACDAIAKAWRPYRTVGSWSMRHVVETKEAAYTSCAEDHIPPNDFFFGERFY